jgi:hypothetical protein
MIAHSLRLEKLRKSLYGIESQKCFLETEQAKIRPPSGKIDDFSNFDLKFHSRLPVVQQFYCRFVESVEVSVCLRERILKFYIQKKLQPSENRPDLGGFSDLDPKHAPNGQNGYHP